MIHAAKFYYILNKKETFYLLNKYKENSLNIVLEKISNQFKGITAWISDNIDNMLKYSPNSIDKIFVNVFQVILDY